MLSVNVVKRPCMHYLNSKVSNSDDKPPEVCFIEELDLSNPVTIVRLNTVHHRYWVHRSVTENNENKRV